MADKKPLLVTRAMRIQAARDIHQYEYADDVKCGTVCDCTTHANIALDVVDASSRRDRKRAKR